MHDSDLFPRTGKDTPSQFWSAYERMAQQHDNEFLERQNSDMDVLLIFVRATSFCLPRLDEDIPLIFRPVCSLPSILHLS